MSKHKIRQNKTCQNCGAFVDKNFCPKCGQENSESRQSFHHLFTHFIFDFFHYDSAFWKTTKSLLFSPGKLSMEYMNGKRKSYVNPFSLYIFVSFVTFFIPSVLPKPSNIEAGHSIERKISVDKDSIQNADITEVQEVLKSGQLDSIYKSRPKEKQPLDPDGSLYKSSIKIVENIQDKHRQEKAFEFFMHNLPKVLFVYMPIFAFWLWLFNNKKKRYYFDSGIFTLHFFSIFLLSITICNIASCAFDWLGLDDIAYSIIWSGMFLYVTFYFFRGSRRFYGESRFISNLKSFTLMFINNLLIMIILILYGLFILYKIYT